MSTNLDSILAAAQAQSANLQQVSGTDTGTALAPINPMAGGGAVAAFNMSEDAFLNPGGMECESYIQVKDAGIKLSKDWQGYIDEFEAILDPRDVQFFMGIRKEVGSNVSYAKSYDGVSTARGENFAQIVADFRATSQKPAEPYRGADIPLTLVSAIADPKGKGPSFEQDAVVGLTTSITGFKPFATFMRKLKDAGLANGPINIICRHSPRKNAAGQEYGVITYDLAPNQSALAA